MKSNRKKLAPMNNKALLDLLEKVRATAELKSYAIAGLEKRVLNLVALKDEAEQFCDSDAVMQLSQLKTQYSDAGLTEE